jgi:hypothetical protein
MNLKLTNIRIYDKLSEETLCFTAKVYLDGDLIMEASNHGMGGCHEWVGLNSWTYSRFAALEADLAALGYTGFDGPFCEWIDERLDDHLITKEMAKASKTAKLVIKPDGSMWSVQGVPAQISNYMAKNPQAVLLSALDADSAFLAFKAAA